MAGITIRVRFDDRRVRRALDALIRAGGDLGPAMQDIGEELLDSARERFSSQVSPDGTPWAPLSPVTKAQKRRNADKILTESGDLRRELVVRAGPDFVEVGSSRIYAGTHQFGAKKGSFGSTSKGAPIPWGDIPPRPFLVDAGGQLAPDDEAAILDTLVDHLRSAIG